MSKAIETSRTRLWERLQTILDSQLGTELTAIADSGLYLPAPDADAYYLLDDGGPDAEELANHNVAVFMWASGPRSFPTQYSGGSTTYGALSHLPITVEIWARFAPQGDQTEVGRVLPPRMLETWRAERYAGALVKTIYKHVRVADDIYNIALLGDGTRLDEGWAVASTQWLAQQDVLIPTPDYATV
jgi:hypothetical protein